MSSAENQYLFEVTLPALGYNTYYFQAKDQQAPGEKKNIITTENQACILQNEVQYHSLMLLSAAFVLFLTSICVWNSMNSVI